MWNLHDFTKGIKTYLPPTAELIESEGPVKQALVRPADLDGDGIPEIVAAYRWHGENYILILKYQWNTWHAVGNIKGLGYNVSYLHAAPVTSRRHSDLIVGWQVGAIWSKLSIYRGSDAGWIDVVPEGLNFSFIDVEDMPGEKGKDGKAEIALWIHDTGEAYQIKILRWKRGQLRPATDVYPYYFHLVVEYYQELTKNTPDSPVYWYYLADAQVKAGMLDEGLKSIDKALSFEQPYPSLEQLVKLREEIQPLVPAVARQTVRLFPASVKTVDGTKWGYIDETGKFILTPKFEYAMDFQPNGLAVVELNHKQGLINQAGQFVVEPKYETITTFSEGRAEVIDVQGFKVINEQGQVLTDKPYSFIGMYQEGRAQFSGNDAQGNNRYGYLDLEGKEVIPLQYITVTDFKQGKAVVQMGEKQYALIDRDGKTLATYSDAFVGNLGEGLLVFKKDNDAKAGYMDEQGNVVISPQFAMGEAFEKERAVVNVSDSYVNQFGLIDKKGNFLIKPKYNVINRLGDNRVAVGKAIDEQQPYLGSKYAIADLDGNFLTDFIYDGVEEFKQGYASAYNNKTTFFIDESGKAAKDLPIVQGTGTLSFAGNLIKAFVDNRVSYLDRSGRVVWQQNTEIPINQQYSVLEMKYQPNKDYLVYYPQVQGMENKTAQENVNTRLKELSQVKPIDAHAQLEYSYTGDFSVQFFKKDLLELELEGYNYPFGAAHGMPSRIYSPIDLRSGRFYELKDLFKPNSNYVQELSSIIGNQIKSDPQYSFVFPDAYKGIKADQPFYVTEEALFIYFNPYDIAPYAAGFPTFKIPYQEIMNIIDTEGQFWQSYHYASQ
jgi:hypothetical protein